MSDAERREKARLRSERWRRARGIMPRRPAQRPWLAEGVSRSTWYRRRKQARERAALADLNRSITRATLNSVITRASSFVAQLQRELAEVARWEAITAAIIGGKLRACSIYAIAREVRYGSS